MENVRDEKAIMEQINQLKDYNEKTREHLAAIQLLMVDDNNGRVKDRVLATNFESLDSKINTVNTEIDVIVNRISSME